MLPKAVPGRPVAAPESWTRSVIGYVSLAVILGLGGVFAVIAMLPIAFLLVSIAIPYTVIATVIIVRMRRSARAALAETGDSEVHASFVTFGGRSQRWSLMNGAVLGVLGLVILAETLLEPWLDEELYGGLIFLYGLAAILSALEIAVNAAWIYGRSYVRAEEYALANRTGAWKLILANRILGWVIWFTGSMVAGWLLVVFLIQGAEF